MTAVLLPFPSPEIVGSYRVLIEPCPHSTEALALAVTILFNAIRAGQVVPPSALDRLVLFALYGVGHLDLRRRLADALASVDDNRVRLRALVLARDPATPPERAEVASRLLGGARR